MIQEIRTEYSLEICYSAHNIEREKLHAGNDAEARRLFIKWKKENKGRYQRVEFFKANVILLITQMG